MNLYPHPFIFENWLFSSEVGWAFQMILFEILYPIHYTCIRDSKLYMYTVNALGYRSVGLTSRRATVPIIKKEILQFKAQKNALVLDWFILFPNTIYTNIRFQKHFPDILLASEIIWNTSPVKCSGVCAHVKMTDKWYVEIRLISPTLAQDFVRRCKVE